MRGWEHPECRKLRQPFKVLRCGEQWRRECDVLCFKIAENVEIANTHAVFMYIAENMVGCGKRLGE
jgi:hypothetical protein